jgi:hypothetical protein
VPSSTEAPSWRRPIHTSARSMLVIRSSSCTCLQIPLWRASAIRRHSSRTRHFSWGLQCSAGRHSSCGGRDGSHEGIRGVDLDAAARARPGRSRLTRLKKRGCWRLIVERGMPPPRPGPHRVWHRAHPARHESLIPSRSHTPRGGTHCVRIRRDPGARLESWIGIVADATAPQSCGA